MCSHPVMIFIGFLAVAMLVFFLQDRAKQKRLRKYWSRSSSQADWQQQFPDVSEQDIQGFLEIFVNAFLFKKEHLLKFGPADKVVDVYRTVYTSYSLCDTMELEFFILLVKKKYGVDLEGMRQFAEMTLGEVFEIIRNHKQAINIMPPPAEA